VCLVLLHEGGGNGGEALSNLKLSVISSGGVTDRMTLLYGGHGFWFSTYFLYLQQLRTGIGESCICLRWYCTRSCSNETHVFLVS
jgi:hypothetical protein